MKRRTRGALLASVLMLVALPVFASQASAQYDVSSPPTFTFSPDESTPQVDDVPGQKDLNAHAVATVPGTPVQLWTAVKWDDLDFSGGNTGDSCALFDTDLDNNANYVVCLVIAGKPAAQVTTAARQPKDLQLLGQVGDEVHEQERGHLQRTDRLRRQVHR